jgi:predicted AAA+ superfamily ATPase
MQNFIHRDIEGLITKYMEIFPAIAILGARQSGKSTVIKQLASTFPSFLYLDLQSREDLNKISEPYLFFEANKQATICLDEIQMVPDLFSILRSVIDNDRANGKFILLGSASRDLVQHTSETLAGRIGLLNLTPFTFQELQSTEGFTLNRFWLRGGFPDSYLASTDEHSKIWRENYLRTYVERDIPQLGFQIPALQLLRFLQMCSHNHGQLLNASKLGASLGWTHPTVRKYVDILEQTFILRALLPYEANVKKRLVKSPKIYVRDTGLLHRLLQLDDYNSLAGHPVFGSSWEGLIIENIIFSLPDWQPYFYRTSGGDEVDLVLEKGQSKIVVVCKASTAPQLTKGFWNAVEVLRPDHVFVIAPIEGNYPLQKNVTVCSLSYFCNSTNKLFE